MAREIESTTLREIMNAKLSIEKVSPNRARELLSNLFPNQRPQRASYIEYLSGEMKAGRWLLSSDALLLVKGTLANGQHRLSAVLKSNVTCPFIIMETSDEELYKVIDAGRKRTVGDVLIGAKNSNAVASIASWMLKYEKGLITHSTDSGSGGSGNKYNRSDVIDFAESHISELEECASCCYTLYKQSRIMPISISGALLFIGIRKGKEKAFEFISSVYEGTSHDDAAWDYREKWIKNQMSKAKMSNGIMFAMGIKAMRSYFQGTRPGVLKFAIDEEFPVF